MFALPNSIFDFSHLLAKTITLLNVVQITAHITVSVVILARH